MYYIVICNVCMIILEINLLLVHTYIHTHPSIPPSYNHLFIQVSHPQSSVWNYRQIFNIRGAKSPNGFLYTIHLSQVLGREWRCSWSSAYKRCSKYIWVVNNYFAYYGALILGVWRYITFQTSGKTRILQVAKCTVLQPRLWKLVHLI